MQTTRALPLALGLLTALPALQAQGQAYLLSTSSRSFVSISTSGTDISPSDRDDGTTSVALPFAFPFFGQTQPVGTPLYPSVNGLVALSSQSAYQNAAIPSASTPNGFIAAFWGDLNLSTAGHIYARGTASSLVIEWSNVQVYNVSAEVLSFQLELRSDGSFSILAGPRFAGTTGRASIGVESPDGMLGAAASCTPACSLSDASEGTSFDFTPGRLGADLHIASFTGGLPGGTVTPGSSFNVNFRVENLGSLESAGNRLGIFVSTSPSVGISDPLLCDGRLDAISAGSSTDVGLACTIPGATPSGTYYAAAIIDASNEVTELDEANNLLELGAFTVGAVTGQITISTTSLPSALVGDAYSAQLGAAGAPSISWRVVSGALPAWLTLSQSGLLSGTPTRDGSSNFTVEAFATGYASAQQAFTLSVSPAGSLSLSSTPLVPATVGVAYSGRVEARGGTPPYALQLLSGGPPWLFMDSSGNLSGTPTASGRFDLRISLADSAAHFAEGVAALEVIERLPLGVSTSELDPAVVGVAYTQSVQGSGGVPPYAFALNSGSLPDGLELGSDGRISGLPTRAGAFAFEVRVTDAASDQATKALSIQATERTALRITVPARIELRFGQEAEVALTAEGGVRPYTWSLGAGMLPAGIRLDVDHLRGSATSSLAPDAEVLLVVTDAEASSAELLTIVHVTTTSTRSPGGPRGGTGGTRAGGCGCSVAPVDPQSPSSAGWAVLLAILGLRASLGRRSVVSRRRWRSTLIQPSPEGPRSSRPSAQPRTARK